MKRLVLALAAVLVIANTAPAKAQDGNVSVQFENAPLNVIVGAIAAGQGYKLNPTGGLPADNVTINITNKPLMEALTEMLSPRGYGVLIDASTKTITTYPLQQGGVTAPAIRLGPSPIVSGSGLYLPPPAYVVPTSGYRGIYLPPPAYVVPTSGYRGIYSNGGYPYYGGAIVWKGCLTGPSGYLKFEYYGDADDRKLWYISINGEVIGTIDQGDSIFNRVDVCAAPTRVTIKKLGGGTWDANYSVRPGTLTKIGVGDFLFAATTPTPSGP